MLIFVRTCKNVFIVLNTSQYRNHLDLGCMSQKVKCCTFSEGFSSHVITYTVL